MVSIERGTPAIPGLDPLRERFAGQLLQPRDPAYEQTRKIWNGMIDKHPALIAQCTGVADVMQAVQFAGEQGLSPSVRGGGHNVAGHAVSDGGLMIDLSRMRSVYVDPARRTARVEGGALGADLDRETAVFDLATTGGVISTTGVAGLTLGGGTGWLIGRHGLAIDNLLSMDVVTADGKPLHVSEAEHPDLFWALRGGGGNFGVVTSFEFQLYPLEQVLAGALVWTAERARELLEFYREFTETNPEDMTTYLQFGTDPESGMRIIGMAVFYPGDIEEGQRWVDKLRAVSPPLLDRVKPMRYQDWQRASDPKHPHGRRYYWKGVLTDRLRDEVIDTVLDHAVDPPLPNLNVTFEHYRGALNRVEPEATAFWHRDTQYQLVMLGGWDNPLQDETSITWLRTLNAAVEPYSTRARILNFNAVEKAERTDVIRASFGPNFERLVNVKRQYDPLNLFKENNNIPPDL